MDMSVMGDHLSVFVLGHICTAHAQKLLYLSFWTPDIAIQIRDPDFLNESNYLATFSGIFLILQIEKSATVLYPICLTVY